MTDLMKSPRLFIEDDIAQGANIILSPDHVHYLINVMRKSDDDQVRIFNGRDGEYAGILKLQSKKQAHIIDIQKIFDQLYQSRAIHLYIAPIKKDRMAFLIEKAVELGVTDIHPVITERTQNGKINENKTLKKIIEASEQCERMDIPTLHPVLKLRDADFHAPTFAAIERSNAPFFGGEMDGDIGLLIGPEGGFSVTEIDYLMVNANIIPCSLGDRILRAETAAFFMLSRVV